MTLPPDFHPTSRTRLLQVAAATWLLLVSAAVVVNHVSLSRLAEDARASAPAIEVALLDSRLTELELLTDSTGHELEPLTQASLDTVRQALEERLARLEQADTEPPATTDIAHLQTRLDQLEARLKEVRQPPPSAAAPARRLPPAEAARPATVEPPFRLLDIELRAGERFLSIAPADSRSLAAVRVLRLGETESGWRLESLEGRTATFLFNGQARRLNVP
ncbi:MULTISPECIES: hypothetical protein [Stutzerimonas]|uniref:Uncharacterized protein n=1 Tax=Stutzerimonas stutzeri TaxID=316 RepID=A0AA42PB26_STUST|nr:MULTISPECIES: hypothetical protein [Stutzerimonas]MDH1237936.1 hypothetical protein [Stutzerimonas stutzeri]MDL2176140.1 hypothetical protein [Stutzerimonas sp. FeSN7]HCF1813067.1 hypothetical protein [Pseudomonas aeruginosa]HCF4448089.1 hypothetical protein [Pseudomonas aeruginosa]|tara:strand:- start:126571 stop:127230 length:660 start_codon:yes stop_codon:yes gene_type:complete